jgi:hypothetical protein
MFGISCVSASKIERKSAFFFKKKKKKEKKIKRERLEFEKRENSNLKLYY